MRNEYYVFFEDVNDFEIAVLDCYWLINDKNEFFYTVEKIIKMFDLDGYKTIKCILKKTAKVGFFEAPTHCSKCKLEYYINNRASFKNKVLDCFNDVCNNCIEKDEIKYAVDEWNFLKERILDKNPTERFSYIPYHLKLVFYGYLTYFYKSSPENFNWSNYIFVGTKNFDDIVFQQFVLEGLIYKFEDSRIFDRNNEERNKIDETLLKSLKNSDLNDYKVVKNLSKNPGFVSLYCFDETFFKLKADLLFMEKNIRDQILRSYDVDCLQDFILDMLADRCVHLCFYRKHETKVDFYPSQNLYNLFKEILLNLSVSQVYSIIYNAFKNVASFLYSNAVDNNVKKHLIKQFISRDYHRVLMSNRNVPSFDLYYYKLDSVFDKIVCNYIFNGKIRSLNDLCVKDIIRFFINNTKVPRISSD